MEEERIKYLLRQCVLDDCKIGELMSYVDELFLSTYRYFSRAISMEEAKQACIIKLWNNIDKINLDRPVYGIICRIFKTAILTEISKQSRGRKGSVEYNDQLHGVAVTSSVDLSEGVFDDELLSLYVDYIREHGNMVGAPAFVANKLGLKATTVRTKFNQVVNLMRKKLKIKTTDERIVDEHS